MFVDDKKVACYQTIEGEVGALDYDAFLTWRKGLADVERDGLNVIWIISKMGFKKRRLVGDALTRIEARQGGAEDAASDRGATSAATIGAYQVALMHHNILSWEGPAFAGVPCTEKNIDRLDAEESLVAFVIDQIRQRNETRPSPDPKSAGASGSSVAGAVASTAA
jgi:hypothetical protein